MRVTKVNTDIVQWLIRSAYEEGYNAATSDRGVSGINPSKGKWFDLWHNSQARKMLIANGVISGDDYYR